MWPGSGILSSLSSSLKGIVMWNMASSRHERFGLTWVSPEIDNNINSDELGENYCTGLKDPKFSFPSSSFFLLSLMLNWSLFFVLCRYACKRDHNKDWFLNRNRTDTAFWLHAKFDLICFCSSLEVVVHDLLIAFSWPLFHSHQFTDHIILQGLTW